MLINKATTIHKNLFRKNLFKLLNRGALKGVKQPPSHYLIICVLSSLSHLVLVEQVIRGAIITELLYYLFHKGSL